MCLERRHTLLLALHTQLRDAGPTLTYSEFSLLALACAHRQGSSTMSRVPRTETPRACDAGRGVPAPFVETRMDHGKTMSM